MSENIFYDCIVVGGGPRLTAASFFQRRENACFCLKRKVPARQVRDAISGKSLAVLEAWACGRGEKSDTAR